MESRPNQQHSQPEASLEELLEQAESKYRTTFETIKVGEKELSILQIADMETHLEQMLDSQDDLEELALPFWARIWPTSILLSYYVQRLSTARDLNLLELGAGIGVCGLFAASQGLRVTISDIHDDALLFSRINILRNNLQDRAEVAKIDFTTNRLDRRFDIILGSEILYRESSYRPLSKFLSRHIASSEHSEIILAKSYHFKAKQFFRIARNDFHIQERVIGYREQSCADSPEKDRHLSQIYRLRPRRR